MKLQKKNQLNITIWVEFLSCARLAPRIFLVSVFLPPDKPIQFDLNRGPAWKPTSCFFSNTVIDFTYLFIYLFVYLFLYLFIHFDFFYILSMLPCLRFVSYAI